MQDLTERNPHSPQLNFPIVKREQKLPVGSGQQTLQRALRALRRGTVLRIPVLQEEKYLSSLVLCSLVLPAPFSSFQ